MTKTGNMFDKKIISIIGVHILSIIIAICIYLYFPSGDLGVIMLSIAFMLSYIFFVSLFSALILFLYKTMKEKAIASFFTAISVLSFILMNVILKADFSLNSFYNLFFASLFWIAVIYVCTLVLHFLLKKSFSFFRKFYSHRIWSRKNYCFKGIIIGILLFEVPLLLYLVGNKISSTLGLILSEVFALTIWFPALFISALLFPPQIQPYLAPPDYNILITMHLIYPILGLLIGGIITFIKKKKDKK